jgi:hypothetical protein
MSLVALSGQLAVPFGPSPFSFIGTAPASLSVTIDAANEACIMIGHLIWADGGSHTVDTTGSSSIGWRTGSVTFANAGTTVKVGLAAVDTANGPAGRAVNVADVVTFDVSKSLTGGGGGITSNAWQTHVPDTGTKTIANAGFLALCIQATARAGADSIVATTSSVSNRMQFPQVTEFTGGAYAGQGGVPNAIITASDGTLGYFYGSSVYASINTRTWNSGSSPSEYGQLYQFPFAISVYGIYGWCNPSAVDLDLVLYTDPLGTPVAQKTLSLDGNTTAVNATRQIMVPFAAPYLVPPNTPFVTALKPGASNITMPYKTLAAATHRITDPWGTSGYGVSRAGGAFSDANSGLDHYLVGPLAGALGNNAARLVNGGMVQ